MAQKRTDTDPEHWIRVSYFAETRRVRYNTRMSREIGLELQVPILKKVPESNGTVPETQTLEIPYRTKDITVLCFQ